jgi:hypothetical protein
MVDGLELRGQITATSSLRKKRPAARSITGTISSVAPRPCSILVLDIELNAH